MDRHETHDVIVAGAGPIGSIAALALARAGFDVALVGPSPAADDQRTTALMLPALDRLGQIGLPPFSATETAPLQAMRIVDATRRLVRSSPVTFRASEIGAERFGVNVPNRVLLRMLDDAVAAAPILRVGSMVGEWRLDEDRATALLPDGTPLRARLAVAADGRASRARDAAGIAVVDRTYPQSALVVNFGHSRGHGSVSTEFHTETGPFTQVPLPGDRSSLVWVVAPETADALAGLGDAELSLRIEERMQSILGRIAVEPGRQIYPMTARQPATVAARRVALVGEAAHVFPPIGAQGMNLGIRDVCDLVEVAQGHRDDPGGEPALAAYRSARRLDILARQAAVNALNMTLLSDLLPAQLVRSGGLGLLAGLSPLRAFVMREGMQPGSGFARIASGWRKQVRR